jgi:DNA-binding transcriptional regulator LsrR (DeoR family)
MLKKNKSTGSICCHFYDADGKISYPQLDGRTINVSLESIKNAECVITCVVGEEKAQAIYSVLKAGFNRHLAKPIDLATLKNVL